MQAVLFTDTDQIRAVLGISGKDISDEVLVDRGLTTELRIDLLGWLPNYQAAYDNGVKAGATDVEQALRDVLVLYCTYYSAALVSTVLPMLSIKSIGDGKNAMERFSPPPWADMTKQLNNKAAAYKTQIQALVGLVAGNSGGFSVFSAVGLAVDPVTNEGA